MTRSVQVVRTPRFRRNQQGRSRLPAIATVTALLAVGVVPVGLVMTQAQAAPKTNAAGPTGPTGPQQVTTTISSGPKTSLCIDPSPTPVETNELITSDPSTVLNPNRNCNTPTPNLAVAFPKPAVYGTVPGAPTPPWVGAKNTGENSFPIQWYIYDAHFTLTSANASIQIYALADDAAGVFLNGQYLNSQTDDPTDLSGHNYGVGGSAATPLKYGQTPQDIGVTPPGLPFGTGFRTGDNVVEFVVRDTNFNKTGISFSIGLTQGPCGTLKICKVAGSGVTPGTNFTFVIPVPAPVPGGSPGALAVVVPAGPAPGGYCKIVPVQFPVGSSVGINETVPSADQVISITSNAAVFNSVNGGSGVVITMLPVSSEGTGVTEVTFTDASKQSGFLEICKALTPGTPTTTALFHFAVNGGSPIAIPAGACSSPINLPAANNYTVTEVFNPAFPMRACNTVPTSRLVAGSCNPLLHKVKVNVLAGGISTETILTISDGRPLANPNFTTQASLSSDFMLSDDATLTGNAVGGPPTGTVTVHICLELNSAGACTIANAVGTFVLTGTLTPSGSVGSNTSTVTLTTGAGNVVGGSA